jgi:hypothetical protein
MDASPLLVRVLAALAKQKLDAVLIGNAAAAILGAPVTTLDFDFMFRDTTANLRKLKAVAASLEAVILWPFYPVSKLYRMVDDASGLQADFMPVIHGVRSFEGLRARASAKVIGGLPALIASPDDIIASKKAAGRERDLAVLPVPNRLVAFSNPRPAAAPDMAKKTKHDARRESLAALGKESDRQLEDLIRRRLAMPVEKRMNFLRKRLPGGGSCL